MAYTANPYPHAPTFASTGTSQPFAAAPAASVGASMDPITAGIGAAGSILGGLFSGQRALNKANTNILKELLAQFTAQQPIRTGIQTSMLGRLPGYMQGNFNVPNAPAQGGMAGLIAQMGGRGHRGAAPAADPRMGSMPNYGTTGVMPPGPYPTFPGFNTSAMGEWKP